MQHDSPPLTATNSSEGLARLLQAKRGAIDEECRRFATRADAEALHDLRVAMRRLHSLFVAFSPLIAPQVPFPRQLRQLQKSTNHARDLEVSLALLKRNRLELPWLLRAWQEQLEDEYRQLRHTLPPAWQALAPALDAPEAILDTSPTDEPLGEQASLLLRQKTKKLKRRRKALCRGWRDGAAHKLRIAGKQARYLLEPFATESPSVRIAVEQLKPFQDLLGDYHDIVVLQEQLQQLLSACAPAARTQLKAAVKLLRQRQQTLRKQFQSVYCAEEGKRLRQTLHRATAALAKR